MTFAWRIAIAMALAVVMQLGFALLIAYSGRGRFLVGRVDLNGVVRQMESASSRASAPTARPLEARPVGRDSAPEESTLLPRLP